MNRQLKPAVFNQKNFMKTFIYDKSHADVWLLSYNRLVFYSNVFFVNGLFLDRTHIVSGHREGESPVDECKCRKEAYHHHILQVAGFKEEEPYQKEEDAVNQIQPPVFSLPASG